jgi:ribosomal protein S18 acetylase RimI-like enzyme
MLQLQPPEIWRRAAAAPFVAKPEHLEAAVTVLTKAFATDPITVWYLRADARQGWALRNQFVGILGGWALGLGHTYLAQDGGACAVFLPPEPNPEGRGSDGRSVSEWLSLLWRIRRNTGVVRLQRGIRLIAAMDQHHPHSPPHAYLWFLGVDPERAGHGVGSSLLTTILAAYDKDGVPTYLENSNPKNTAFYRRHGYRSLGEYHPLLGGPPLDPMWRDARG